MTAVAVAAALTAGAPGVHALMLGLALTRPWWALTGVGLWAVYAGGRRRGPGPEAAARFFRAVAAELQAGAGLRRALTAAAGRVPELELDLVVRAASAGRPIPEVGAALRAALPDRGRHAAAALRLGNATGARLAAVFGRLAADADAEAELIREQRVLTAQARLSALIVAVAPVGFALLVAASGRGPDLADPADRAVVVVGLGLEMAGLAVVAMMVRAAGR